MNRDYINWLETLPCNQRAPKINAWMGGWMHGLMVAAVAVVAQAALGLQRKLAPDRQWVSLMVAAAVLMLLVPRVWSQLLALLLGGLVGLCALTPPELEPSAPERLVVPLRRSVSVVLLGFAVLLFVAMPWLSAEARPLLVQQLSGFFTHRCLGVRWWSCGAPLAGTSLGTQRLDRPAAVSRGVWRSPGGARADVQFRGFSWL